MYFEIDDIKRRHSPYFDVYNVHGWIDPPADQFWWNWVRGSIAGVTGYLANELLAHRWENYKLLRTKFHPPESISQLLAYNKAITSMENYKSVFLADVKA